MTKPLFAEDQVDVIVSSMINGIHGSFARAIGEAYLLADSTNQQIILKSFSSLFSKVASFLDIKPTFDEAKHEAFIERRMSILDKKLMQGHISQDDYESMVKALNEVTL
jgi:hypothetical protein